MSFSKKAAEIMHTLQTDYGDFKIPINKKPSQTDKQQTKPCKHSCSAVQVKISAAPTSQRFTRQTLFLQSPIIIQKKSQAKSLSARHNLTDRKFSNVKKVDPFVPIVIPTRDRNKIRLENTTMETTRNGNKQIQIIIDDDGNDKECLKKLFKKISNLTEQLAQSEGQRIRLKLQLDHLSRRDISCKEHQKIINKLEGEKFKLEMEVEMLKKNSKEQARMSPKETIKQMVVQRPVQVRVEVPKYIPGPERIVQRIVQVPKYIEIEKKMPGEVIVKEIDVPRIIQKPVYIDKPVYRDPIIVDKPVYIDKPIYIDRPVEVEKKVSVEVPFEVEVPVYIDRPVIDEDWLRRFQDIEDELGVMMKENQYLKNQNYSMKATVSKLQNNLELLNQHNRQKNREVELLLSNRGDYLPPQQTRLERKYSALDRTSSTLSPRSHHHLRFL